MNLELLAGEGTSAFTADVQDAAGKQYKLKVEYLGQVPGFEGITMVILRLADDLGDVGDVLLRLNLHGMSSNRVRIAVGHMGGGPADDPGAIATPAPATPPPPDPIATPDPFPGVASDGGVLRFGPDGKLYILFGDNGRRGFLQNITSGGPVPDDQFGGPEPDDAHMTGVILRLNDDGSTPPDNPFFNANSGLTGEAAANLKKIFAYGVRNGFGMAFDPISGFLWTQENGDDAFDEMNRYARFQRGVDSGYGAAGTNK